MATRNKPASKPVKEAASAELVLSEILDLTVKKMEKMGGNTELIYLAPSTRGTLVVLTGASSTIEAGLPFQIENLATPIGINRATLLTAIKGRKLKTAIFKGDSVRFSNGSYSSTLVTTEVSAMPRAEKLEKPDFTFTLDSNLWQGLNTAVANVKIEKSHSALPDVTVSIQAAKKTVTVVSYDAFQVSYVKFPNPGAQVFQMTLPLSQAEALFRDFPGDVVIAGNEAMLAVSSKSIRMSSALPSLESASGLTPDVVLDRVKKVLEEEMPYVLSFPVASLKSFLENSRALDKPDSEVEFKLEPGVLTLVLSSNGNSVALKIKCDFKKSLSFKLDLKYLKTLATKSGDNVELSVNDALLLAKSEKSTYISILSSNSDTVKEKEKGKKGKKQKAEVEEEEEETEEA